MAKKTQDEVEDTSVAAPVRRNKLLEVGIDSVGSGSYNYVDAPEGWHRDRVIRIGGNVFEHVDDDGDGCWLYRSAE